MTFFKLWEIFRIYIPNIYAIVFQMGRKRKYFTLNCKKLIQKFASYCFYYTFALANRNKRPANMLSISTEKMDQQNAPPSASISKYSRILIYKVKSKQIVLTKFRLEIMKKIIAMAALVLSSVGAFAQYSAGDFTLQPKVGLNCTSITGDNDADYKAGFVGGLEAEYHVNPLVGISAGVLYSMQGAKATLEGKEMKYNMDYVNIPILANFYVTKGLALKAGIQPGFKASSSVKLGSVKVDDETGSIKSVDFSVPVGISYEYEGFCLDARYNIGCTKVFKEGDGNHSVFQLTLGYKFKL